MICKNTEAHRKTHLLLTISFPFLRHAEWFSTAQKRRAKKKKKNPTVGSAASLGVYFTWDTHEVRLYLHPKVFKMHSKGTEREGTGKVTPFTMINSFQDVFFFRKILDLCTRPSREHHPWQFVLIYSRLKQDINKAVVLGSTCPHRAVCQSGRQYLGSREMFDSAGGLLEIHWLI